MKTKCANGNTVNNWYDRKTRSSVVQVLDPAGNQIGDADYSGNRVSARFSKAAAIRANGGRADPTNLDLIESIIYLLRRHGPMNADGLQRWMKSQGQSVTFAALASTMMAEEARDARTRRLRRATGYPPGYYISFDNNAGRD